jgi:hypothetical protein
MIEQSIHDQNNSVLAAVIIIVLVIAFVLLLSLYSGANSIKKIVAAGNMSTSSIDLGTEVVANQNIRLDNFLILGVGIDNVTGKIFTLYPLASANGTDKTLHIGDTIGYACDGTLAELAAINGTRAIFTVLVSKPQQGGCPI